METTTTAENRPSLAFGAALLVVAAEFLFFAKDIPRTGLAGDSDPGPRALPVAMALVVAAGGCIELIRVSWSAQRIARERSAKKVPPSGSSKIDAGTTTSWTNFGILTAAVFFYLVGLSWLGFQVSTLVFTTGTLIWFGSRWWSALLCSLGIVLVVRLLFVGLFHVQLPAGAFGWAL